MMVCCEKCKAAMEAIQMLSAMSAGIVYTKS